MWVPFGHNVSDRYNDDGMNIRKTVFGNISRIHKRTKKKM